MQYFINLNVLLSNIMLIRFLMKLELINLVKSVNKSRKLISDYL